MHDSLSFAEFSHKGSEELKDHHPKHEEKLMIPKIKFDFLNLPLKKETSEVRENNQKLLSLTRSITNTVKEYTEEEFEELDQD